MGTKQVEERDHKDTGVEREPIPFDEALRCLVNTPPKPRKAKVSKQTKASKPKGRA